MEIHVSRITDIHAVRNGHVVIHADMSHDRVLDLLSTVPNDIIAEYAALHGIEPKHTKYELLR